MNLKIGDYKIESDGTWVTLFKAGVFGPKSKKAGQETEAIIGHYPNLEQAIMRLLEERIAGYQVILATDLITGILAVKKEIILAVKAAGH